MAGNKKKTVVQGPVVPTSANADRLLRELMSSQPDWSTPEIEALDAAVTKRERELLEGDDLLKDLKAMYEQGRAAHQEYRNKMRDRINRCRKLYLAEGVTPRVAKELVALVEELCPEPKNAG